MVTMVGTESSLAKLLSNLVELDFDAIEAYQVAIDKLDDKVYKTRLAEFMKDHERHTRELGIVLEEMGEETPDGADIMRFLTKGKVYLGNLFGDKQILMAMKANEEVTNKAYEAAVKHKDAPAETRQILERNLADERRHRAWIDETLERL